ncbi:unnamed protein product [Protopolystoma xenopodis]|uniref:Uncharacterized protein n=1 Tax=Protopolystoma xenopodis TaxID=117903 RepID=A0A448WTX7_9PLAT|nr:unnamed protein product [Protopolystoma xenopodis]
MCRTGLLPTASLACFLALFSWWRRFSSLHSFSSVAPDVRDRYSSPKSNRGRNQASCDHMNFSGQHSSTVEIGFMGNFVEMFLVIQVVLGLRSIK